MAVKGVSMAKHHCLLVVRLLQPVKLQFMSDQSHILISSSVDICVEKIYRGNINIVVINECKLR